MLTTEEIKAFIQSHAAVKKQTVNGVEEYFIEINGRHFTFLNRVKKTDRWFVHFQLKPRYIPEWNCVTEHNGLPDAFAGRRDVVLKKRRLLEDCWNKWNEQLRRELSKVKEKKDAKSSNQGR